MNIKYVMVGLFRDGMLVESEYFYERTTRDYLLSMLDIIQLKGDTPIGCKRCIQYTVSSTNVDIIIAFVDKTSSRKEDNYSFKLNDEIVKESVKGNVDLCSEYAYQCRVNGYMRVDDFVEYRENGTFEDVAY